MSADHSTDGSATALQVARNEITFLENEIEKLREDNHVLQMSASKHEKLVYGSVGAMAPKGTLMKAIGVPPSVGRASNTSVPPTPTRSRTPISTPHGTPLSSAQYSLKKAC